MSHPHSSVSRRRFLERSLSDVGHRRIDARHVKMACRFHDGDGSLRLSLAGPEGGAAVAAVRSALIVVNELFLILHECLPEYLVGQYGASPE